MANTVFVHKVEKICIYKEIHNMIFAIIFLNVIIITMKATYNFLMLRSFMTGCRIFKHVS